MSTPSSTQYAVSADGTRIAYEVRGSGPGLVIVDGALCQRSMGPSRPLAEQLESRFTVHVYDRRGRGESEPGRAAYHPDRGVRGAVHRRRHPFPPHDPELGERTRALIEDGRNGDAVKLFMKTVGAPGVMVAVMRVFPVWKKLTCVAPTLPHDYAIVLDRQQGSHCPTAPTTT